MMYAFAENYILALSHDEVVHGKRSLIDKMWGTYEEKFAQLRLLYAFMYSHPGKKLLFMGGEFGQFVEWRYAEQLDWCLEEYEAHQKMWRYSADLGHFYQDRRSFYEIERELGGEWKGFKWLKAEDASNSILAYMRMSKDQKEEILVALNFTPVAREKYTIGVPEDGDYKVIFNSNAAKYGGDGKGTRTYHAIDEECDGQPFSIEVFMPPLTALYMEKLPPTVKHRKKSAGAAKKDAAKKTETAAKEAADESAKIQKNSNHTIAASRNDDVIAAEDLAILKAKKEEADKGAGKEEKE